MVTPFANDIFALIWQAFRNLYPDKECECFWEPQIREAENGNEVFGLTDFGEDGSIVVFVRPDLEVAIAGEILAHELAHVAVGVDHEHDEAWEDAFEAIFQEYNRIGDSLFENQYRKEIGGCAYCKQETEWAICNADGRADKPHEVLFCPMCGKELR